MNQDGEVSSREESPRDPSHWSTVEKVLGQLPEWKAQVVRFRFGLNGGPLHSLEETGSEFGVDRDAIRQIETETLAKLRIAKGTNPPDSSNDSG
jgi:RNA polymerase primary sigma factor